MMQAIIIMKRDSPTRAEVRRVARPSTVFFLSFFVEPSHSTGSHFFLLHLITALFHWLLGIFFQEPDMQRQTVGSCLCSFQSRRRKTRLSCLLLGMVHLLVQTLRELDSRVFANKKQWTAFFSLVLSGSFLLSPLHPSKICLLSFHSSPFAPSLTQEVFSVFSLPPWSPSSYELPEKRIERNFFTRHESHFSPKQSVVSLALFPLCSCGAVLSNQCLLNSSHTFCGQQWWSICEKDTHSNNLFSRHFLFMHPNFSGLPRYWERKQLKRLKKRLWRKDATGQQWFHFVLVMGSCLFSFPRWRVSVMLHLRYSQQLLSPVWGREGKDSFWLERERTRLKVKWREKMSRTGD